MTEDDNAQGSREALADLEVLRTASRAMGREERLRKHRNSGKLDVRSRIAPLLDRGTFTEIGTVVGGAEAHADAVVIGSGAIDGHSVMVAAEDFTVLAGTIASAAKAKRYRVAELAVMDCIPLVMMLEGAGVRAEQKSTGDLRLIF